MRLEKAIEQERRAESCIVGIYSELHTNKKTSEWLHKRVHECMKRMQGYPRHSLSHVHGFSHGMFIHMMKNSLIYSSKLPCGTLLFNTTHGGSFGIGPREITLKSYMIGHYWPDETGKADPNQPFDEQISMSLLGIDNKVIPGKSYVVLETADNGDEKWNTKKIMGPMSFNSAINHVANKDPFSIRQDPYRIDGPVVPYLYVARAKDSIVNEIDEQARRTQHRGK